MNSTEPSNNTSTLYLGVDVGSTTVKTVVLDSNKNVLNTTYTRSRGQSARTVYEVLSDLFSTRFDAGRVLRVGFTGSGGEIIAALVGGQHMNELVSQTRAVGEFCPQARTVIEMGGQDSKLLILERDEKANKTVLVDFAMNNLCAAGTGSFLDQQADRLGVDIEGEFAEAALQSESPARVAGRCTVFAKSDMIHLQQKGIPLKDILAGICFAVARNFKGTIGKGKRFERPIVFQGGVAYNAAMVRAFEEVLGLSPGELIVPRYHNLMSAMGAAFIAMDEEAGPRFVGLGPLADYLASEHNDRRSMAPLTTADGLKGAVYFVGCRSVDADGPRIPVYLGVDVGSISTNVVLIDRDRNVIARRYLRTEGKPLEAVREGVWEIGQEVGDRVEVTGVGVTGSGRHLTGHFVGADVVRNEITAQATAAIAIDPAVDTVFEIGGQDSKYVRIESGAVVDFEMNKACAAGTGSFLEEQADKLKLDVATEFADLALQSRAPACLGQRCTVFMESDLVAHQQRGAKQDELVGGLAYSIALNYLSNVVKERPIGNNIFFQGGVAWNKAVVAAFEKLTQKRVTVPPHHDVTGAIGAAILAMRGVKGKTNFHGFDLSSREYRMSSFECKACPNICEVSRVVLKGEAPIYFGARCERFEEGKKANAGAELPDLFKEREQWLFGKHYVDSKVLGTHEVKPEPSVPGGKPRIGIPRVLTMYDMFPFWSTFFESMGLEVVLSDATNPQIAHSTTETAAVDACFPVKVVHGHVHNLFDKGVDYIFIPSIINRPKNPSHEQAYQCPYVQAVPYVVDAAIDFKAAGVKLLKPYIHFLKGEDAVLSALKGLAREMGISAPAVRPAMAAGMAAQKEFEARVRARGLEILANLDEDQRAAVLVSRPYNGCDPGMNLDLPAKLRSLGVITLPLDFLPVDEEDIAGQFGNMFWHSGHRILAAGRFASRDDRLQMIYLTSYGCGPDSFILSFFAKATAGKPWLQLEVDDHTGDAGVVTRCEAFFDSLEGLRALMPHLREKATAQSAGGHGWDAVLAS